MDLLMKKVEESSKKEQEAIQPYASVQVIAANT
jgi:hypothetical protein